MASYSSLIPLLARNVQSYYCEPRDIREFCQFVDEILECHRLGPPNDRYTDAFLKDDLRHILTGILGRSRDFGDDVGQMLVKISALFPWSAWNRQSLSSSLAQVFNGQNAIYRNDVHILQNVIDAAVRDQYLVILQVCCIERPDIGAFQCFRYLLEVVIPWRRDLKWFDIFAPVFQRLNAMMTPDRMCDDLVRIITSMTSLSFNCEGQPHTFTKVYESILQFATEIFFDPRFTQKSTEILKPFFDRLDCELIVVQFFKGAPFVRKALGSRLDQSGIELLGRILTLLSRNDSLPSDWVRQFWEGALQQTGKTRATLFDLLVICLSSPSTEKFRSILGAMDASLNASSLPLLIGVASKRKSVERDLIQLIFRLGARSEDPAADAELLADIKSRDVLKLIADEVKTSLSPFAVHVLILLSKTGSVMRRIDATFAQKFLAEISRYPNDKNMWALLDTFFTNGTLPFDQQNAQELLKVGSDRAFGCLKNRLQEAKGMDRTILQTILRALQGVTAPTIEYVECTGLVIQRLNVALGKADYSRPYGAETVKFVARAAPVDSDDLLFAVISSRASEFVIQAAGKELVALYAAAETDWAGFVQKAIDQLCHASGSGKAALFCVLRDICRSESSKDPLSIERHQMPTDLRGAAPVTVPVRLQESNQNFVYPLAGTMHAALIQLGPFLSRHISNYNILNNGQPCFGHEPIDERSSLEVVVGPSDTPPTLLSAQLAPLIPEFLAMLETEHQDVCGAIDELLQLLPNDGALVALSCNSAAFLQEFTRVQSGHGRKYMLEILEWRLKHQGFVRTYQDVNFADNLYPLAHDPVSRSVFGSAVLNVMSLLQGPDLAEEFIKFLLDSLADDSLSEEMKITISDILANHYTDRIGFNVLDYINQIDVAISKMTRPVWQHFSLFIWKFNVGRDKIADMARAKMDFEDHNFYRLIFLRLAGAGRGEKTLPQIIDMIREVQNGLGTDALSEALADFSGDLAEAIGELVRQLITASGDEVIDGLLQLLRKLVKGDPKNAAALSAGLHGLIDEVVRENHWNIRVPEQAQKFRGLRNMGATCYMNSSLQQLFQLPIVQFLLLDTQAPELAGYPELQDLLRSVLTSHSDSCDASAFVHSWRGWGGVGQQIPPGQQQDAAEFTRYLLDFLPERIRQNFRIIQKNVTEGTDIPYRNVTDELLWLLPCAVDGIQTLHQSLNGLFDIEIMDGDNRVLVGSDRIRARRCNRLGTTPPILIINLKRIKYNYQRRQQEKIPSRIEFPSELDLTAFLDQRAEVPPVYDLSGVVIHSGTAHGGHYQSIVVSKGQYYNFNDSHVSKIDKATMERDSFGQDYGGYGSSAYLLFYVLRGGKIEGRAIYAPLPGRLLRAASATFQERNRGQLLDRMAFNDSLLQFVLEVVAFEDLRDFFFDVFCRCQADSFAGQFTRRFRDLLAKDTDRREFVGWLSGNAERKVFPVYRHCLTSGIVQAVTNIVEFAISGIPVEQANDLLHRHAEFLSQCRPENLTHVCQLLLNYIRGGPNNLQFARSKKWSDLLTSAISRVGHRHGGHQYGAVSELATELGAAGDDVGAMMLLPGFGATLRQSMATTGTAARRALDMRLARLTPGGLRGLLSEWEKKVRLLDILLGLVSLNEEGDPIVMADLELVLEWLNNDGADVRGAAKTLLRGVLERDQAAAIVDKMTSLLNRQVTPDFLSVLLDALKAVEYPRERPPPGLEWQTPSDELEAIRAYFGDSAGLLRELTQCAGAVGNPVDLRMRFPAFLRQLDAATDDQITAIVSQGGFIGLASAISVLDLVDLAEDLLTTLINHQAIPECHSQIMRTLKGDEDPYYLKTTMARLKDVSLVNEDVWLLQAVALRLVSVREPHQEVVRMILQPLTEFISQQPGDVSGVGIGDENMGEFLKDGKGDQATTWVLVDFITVCWMKNRAGYELYFTQLTDWLLRERAASARLLAFSAIIARGGNPAAVAAALTEKLSEFQAATNPVSAKKIVDYMHERTKDPGIEWGHAFWVNSLRLFNSAWLRQTADTLIEIFAQLTPDMNLVREIADSCKGVRAADASPPSVLRKAFILARAWPDAVTEMKRLIPYGATAAWGSSPDAQKLTAILGVR